ncbi:hypothetical protein LPJ61_002857 [Coemansia biformis]|uniref:Uncharacterized protein n=1 Tax=Coemansia biformis TaxID=1286918 RepID=A0A9W7YE60_9FUNG|nr:hypothetical protein LPJ61_002857 [Coemansia biformis]
MEYVHQQLHAVIRDLRARRTPQTQDACLAELYALLGRAHMLQAAELVDRGVACLASDGRLLFRVGGGHGACYCVLPGGFCSACARQPGAAVGGAPCVHATAVLVAVAQSRCAVEELPAQELATALFSIT